MRDCFKLQGWYTLALYIAVCIPVCNMLYSRSIVNSVYINAVCFLLFVVCSLRNSLYFVNV